MIKIALDIEHGSFIPMWRYERGVRILAITLAFQAREAGSIPARRSNFSIVDDIRERSNTPEEPAVFFLGSHNRQNRPSFVT